MSEDSISLTELSYEPKRSFRWILEVDGIDAYVVKTAERPKMALGSWQPMRISLFDPIVPNCAQKGI